MSRNSLALAAALAFGLASAAAHAGNAPLAETYLPRAGGPLTGDLFSVAGVVSKSTSGCASTSGQRPTDGTLSWVPSCFGVWASADASKYPLLPTRGIGNDANGNAYGPNGANLLVQGQVTGATAAGGQAVAINFTTIGGSASASSPGGLAGVNGVAEFISVRQAPGPNGEAAPSTWGLNIDFHIAPGAGSTQSWLIEGDLNNFRGSCGVGGTVPCLSVWLWFNGINPYANLAMLYGGGANTLNFAGQATTSGATLTVSSFNSGTAQAFTGDLASITIDGTAYHANMVDATHATVTPTPTAHAGATSFTGVTAQSHFGYFLNGQEQVLEADLRFADSAIWGLQLYGHHLTGIDLTNDTLSRAMTLKANQTVCFNGVDSCFGWGGGVMYYAVGAATPWLIDAAGAQHAAGLYLSAPATAPSSGNSARGRLCLDTGGGVYVGAC